MNTKGIQQKTSPTRAPGHAAAPDLAGVAAMQGSALFFAFPFAFDDDLGSLEKAVTGAEWPGRNEPIWTRSSLPKDDLIRHLADYLNPPRSETDTATGIFWDLTDHATKMLIGSEVGATWRCKNAWRDTAFVIDGVTLAMFRFGMGLLLMQAHPESDAAADWFDFLHDFRFASGGRAPSLHATWLAPAQGPKRIGPLLGSAVQQDRAVSWSGQLGEVLDALLHSVGERSWWSDIFTSRQLIPYTILRLNGPTADDPTIRTLTQRAIKMFHSGQEVRLPDRAEDSSRSFSYAKDQFMFFSMDGGGYLAWNPPPDDTFFAETLVSHLKSQYLFAFVITLVQRFSLTRLSMEVARLSPRRGANPLDPGRIKEYSTLLSRVLDFTARGWFAQVLQSENHHRAYRSWLDTFQIATLYAEVRDEVTDISEYLRRGDRDRTEKERQRLDDQETERQDRGDRAILFLTSLGSIVGFTLVALAVLALFVPDPKPQVPLGTAVTIAAVSVVVASIAVLIWVVALLRKEPKRRQEDGES